MHPTPEGMRHVHGLRVGGRARAWLRAGLPNYCMLRIHMIHAHECMKKTACISAVYRPYAMPPEIADFGDLWGHGACACNGMRGYT